MAKLTEQDRQDIISLVKSGMSYTEVGKKYNKSRCSIAGIIYRNAPKRLLKKPKTGAQKTIIKPIEIQSDDGIIGVSIFDLTEKSCRYMVGNKLYCGLHVDKKSMCSKHYSMCWTKPKKKEK